MSNFCCESKVTRHWIFTVEIWYFVECLRKAEIETTPIQKLNLKAPMHAKSQKPMPKPCFIANLCKLRFYQNKGLSLDKRCGVPNSFSTRNQTFGPKNQDFLPSLLD